MLENTWEATRWVSKKIELGMDWESDNSIKKEMFTDKSFSSFSTFSESLNKKEIKSKDKMKSTSQTIMSLGNNKEDNLNIQIPSSDSTPLTNATLRHK